LSALPRILRCLTNLLLCYAKVSCLGCTTLAGSLSSSPDLRLHLEIADAHVIFLVRVAKVPNLREG